ncbi:MAG: integrase core domain-containing protein [Thalassobaculum sp.]
MRGAPWTARAGSSPTSSSSGSDAPSNTSASTCTPGAAAAGPAHGIAAWIDFYNRRRPHTALAGRTPDAVYWKHRTLEKPEQRTMVVA